ncbi:Trp biosynthesis-associated membrane protein [Ruania alkalisoli]|uniref:Trp biosynthesis-associated membrane protein n=1 Tax=Ruania alkalisoli TaxID=2779775 RepID=A0A7M1SXL9_9MICO|nr:Trp biosynthesis-associated membrane protein [Ruania alkalisoli]QOR72320.1 Trp biosynthesis-associated membrane protein [Ruania alkalisoli]
MIASRSTSEPHRRSVGRRTAVLVLLAVGALLLVLSLPTWAHAPVRTTIGAGGTASVSGADGAPLVPSLALVVIVAGLVIGLAGRVARVVAAVAAALGGLGAIVAVVAFLRDPQTPVQSVAADMTGVRELGGAVTTTVWPWLALVAGATVALVGTLLPWRMGSWRAAARRYERAPDPDEESGQLGRATRMADWDALSRGEDPSDR